MRTIKVRIAVAVGSDDYWEAVGGKNLADEDAKEMLAGWLDYEAYQVAWVTAEIPVSEPVEVEGAVE